MAIQAVGNINGPEGVFKQFGALAQGDTFVFNVNDVSNGVFWIKTDTTAAVGVNGSTQTVPNEQVVVEVGVSAVVTV